MEQLKPCPFCGGQAVIAYAHGCNAPYINARGLSARTIPLYVIQCLDCMAKTQQYERIEDAVIAWNRRADNV